MMGSKSSTMTCTQEPYCQNLKWKMPADCFLGKGSVAPVTEIFRYSGVPPFSFKKFRYQGITFLPLAAETFGGWHEVAVDQVRKLAGALARHNGQEEGEAISHTWSRLGVLLQRGNAAMMANRIPTFPAAPTDGRE